MDPRIALDLGIIKVHWYGIIITFGMLAAIWVISREAKRKGEDPNIVADAAIWVILFGIVGARLYHVLSSPNDGSGSGLQYYLQNPLQIVAIWQGGLGIFGGIFAGFLVIIFIAWRKRLNLLKWLDIVVPGVLLGQAIGRWGNYVNQELYGPPTGSTWWGVTIDAPYRVKAGNYDFRDLNQYPLDTRFHPTFLYESAWNFLGFFLLMWLSRKAKRLRDGDIGALYFIWYGVGRTWVELGFRPDAWTLGSLPTAVWVSFAAIAAGLALMIFNHTRPPRAETTTPPIAPEAPPQDTDEVASPLVAANDAPSPDAPAA